MVQLEKFYEGQNVRLAGFPTMPVVVISDTPYADQAGNTCVTIVALADDNSPQTAPHSIPVYFVNPTMPTSLREVFESDALGQNLL